MPTTICLDCKQEILRSYEFRKKVIDSDAYYRDSCFKIKSDDDFINFKDTQFEVVNVKSDDDDETLEESKDSNIVDKDTVIENESDSINDDDSHYCPSNHDNSDSNESKVESNAEDFPHKCVICSKKFKEMSDLLPHVKNDHTHFMKKKSKNDRTTQLKKRLKTKSTHCDESQNQGISKEKIEPKINERSDCKKDVNQIAEKNDSNKKIKSSIKKSRVKRLSVKSKCPQCNKCYKNVTSLQKHLKDGHKEDVNTFVRVCNICGEGFRKKSTFHDHYKKHFPEKCYTCEICGRIFSNKSNYEQHKVIHSSEKKFKCELCEYRCTTKYSIGVCTYL